MVGGETMSFEDKKGIVVASGFKLQAETLLDARQQVDTLEELKEIFNDSNYLELLKTYRSTKEII